MTADSMRAYKMLFSERQAYEFAKDGLKQLAKTRLYALGLIAEEALSKKERDYVERVRQQLGVEDFDKVTRDAVCTFWRSARFIEDNISLVLSYKQTEDKQDVGNRRVEQLDKGNYELRNFTHHVSEEGQAAPFADLMIRLYEKKPITSGDTQTIEYAYKLLKDVTRDLRDLYKEDSRRLGPLSPSESEHSAASIEAHKRYELSPGRHEILPKFPKKQSSTLVTLLLAFGIAGGLLSLFSFVSNTSTAYTVLPGVSSSTGFFIIPMLLLSGGFLFYLFRKR